MGETNDEPFSFVGLPVSTPVPAAEQIKAAATILWEFDRNGNRRLISEDTIRYLQSPSSDIRVDLDASVLEYVVNSAKGLAIPASKLYGVSRARAAVAQNTDLADALRYAAAVSGFDFDKSPAPVFPESFAKTSPIVVRQNSWGPGESVGISSGSNWQHSVNGDWGLPVTNSEAALQALRVAIEHEGFTVRVGNDGVILVKNQPTPFWEDGPTMASVKGCPEWVTDQIFNLVTSVRNKDFSVCPGLADCIEEAGVTNPELLDPLRDPLWHYFQPGDDWTKFRYIEAAVRVLMTTAAYYGTDERDALFSLAADVTHFNDERSRRGNLRKTTLENVIVAVVLTWRGCYLSLTSTGCETFNGNYKFFENINLVTNEHTRSERVYLVVECNA